MPKKKERKKMATLLFDATYICYRAYYSTGSLSNGKTVTGIPYGFFWTILQMSERFRTNKIILCWDSKHSRRRELFNDYKASRRQNKTEEERAERSEIHAQINALHNEILPRTGFQNNLFQEGLEADDLIARAVIDNPTITFIGVSGDNDLFQLLRFKNFTMFSPTANKLWTASSFAMEYGVPAREWVTVKSIAGCPGDGVPGVPGVAVKTAVQYINENLNVEKKYESIIANHALIKRNYRLVALPFAGTESVKLVEDKLDGVNFGMLFGDLGFRSFQTDEMLQRWEKFVEGY